MDRRQKDIVTMAEQADLVAVSAEKRSSRQYLTCRAENGVERSFSISMGSRSDPRGDLNELSLMKRFARENRMPTIADIQPTQPMKSTEPQKKATLTMQKTAAKTAPAAQLSPVDFYKVCEWLKHQPLATFPNLEALTLGAAKHIGGAVTEADITTAMGATSISEPVHWSEPTDPHTILVRELSTMMKELGVTASPAFARLKAELLPA